MPVSTYDELCARAYEMGADHGRAAASWYFDGNTADETYRSVLRGLEDGDPAIYDSFPAAPLSGEYADAPTPTTVLEELDVCDDDDAADDYLRQYEDGFGVAVADEIERVARLQVFTVEPFAWPGGYPIGYLVDDGQYLCARCVSDPTNPLHLSGNADGWRLEGSQVLEGSADDYDGAVLCAHCSAVLVPDNDDAPIVRCLYGNAPEKDCGARACALHGTPSASPYAARRGAIVDNAETER